LFFIRWIEHHSVLIDDLIKSWYFISSFTSEELIETWAWYIQLFHKSVQASCSEIYRADKIISLPFDYPSLNSFNQFFSEESWNVYVSELFALHDYVIFFSFRRLTKLELIWCLVHLSSEISSCFFSANWADIWHSEVVMWPKSWWLAST